MSSSGWTPGLPTWRTRVRQAGPWQEQLQGCPGGKAPQAPSLPDLRGGLRRTPGGQDRPGPWETIVNGPGQGQPEAPETSGWRQWEPPGTTQTVTAGDTQVVVTSALKPSGGLGLTSFQGGWDRARGTSRAQKP